MFVRTRKTLLFVLFLGPENITPCTVHSDTHAHASGSLFFCHKMQNRHILCSHIKQHVLGLIVYVCYKFSIKFVVL
jgi:hypothetical protein